MNKIKFAVISFALILGITGAVLAKVNEKKRQTSNTAYIRNAANTAWVSVTFSTSVWKALDVTCVQSQITTCSNTQVNVYLTQNINNPAAFVQP